MAKENRFLKLNVSPRTSQKLKRKVIITSVLSLVLFFGVMTYFNFSKETAMASSSGDYRTAASGNWNSISTWQKYNGSSWVAAVATPTSSDGVITIQSGHTVTITANVTADQVVVNSGGQITLNSGITFTIANGSGTDLDVTGIYKSAGTTTINSSATVAFESGGKYQHNFTTTAGTIPTATWNAASTCEVIGYTTNTTAPSGLNQSFGNFTWNCSSQSAAVNLGGNPTSITGNLTLQSTGSSTVTLSSSGSTLAVAGDYVQSGGTFTLSSNSSVSSTLNIAGNYNQSAGTFSVETGNSGTGTINVSGNWSHTGGTLTVGGNSSTNAQVKFNKSGTQTFTASSNTVSGNVDFTVNSGSILTMGTSVLTGRTFTLSSGAELQIGSTAGITSSGATGNIQTTSRSFNAGATYTYNGSSAQNSGNGLPASITNLTLNNSSGLTLTSTTGVSNTLTLTTGKITTGSNELKITNSSTSAIVGYSSSNYIIGNLRQSVTGSGAYTFPVGSSTNYESIIVTLNSTTGFTDILGKFTNANPINSSYPLTGVYISGASVDSMMNYGYWTLTPNTTMTGGYYDIKATEKGYTNTVSSIYYYPLLYRANSTSSWQSNGNDQAFKYSTGAMTANKTGITSFGDLAIAFGQCPPIYSFDNYTLISGTNNQVGAIYLISDIGMGLDAWIQITDFVGGATISDFDNWTPGNGYEDAWQPFINAAANTTSSVGWKIMFKVGGTSTDTIIPNIIFAAIDVDGASGLQEFVTAYQPYRVSFTSNSTLQITNNNGDITATGSTYTYNNIDTNNTPAMFKVNYKNVSSFNYRTGVINSGGSVVRQASLYFKSFVTLPVTLPIKLSYWDAKLNNDNEVELKWITSSETNNDFFTVERSKDGKTFEKVLTQQGAGTSTIPLTYNAVDKTPLSGESYYRLKQTDFDGKFTYSPVKPVMVGKINDVAPIQIQSVAPTLFTDNFNLNFMSQSEGVADLMLTNMSGKLIYKEKINVTTGFNTYQYNDRQNLTPGVYFVILMYDDKKVSTRVVKQ